MAGGASTVSTVTWTDLPPLGLGDGGELEEQTSEVPRDHPTPRDTPRGGLSRTSDRGSSLIQCSARSVYIPGAELPILLPGKLQWVRDKHIQLETAAKLEKGETIETAIGSVRIASLPSELFFGKYHNTNEDTGAAGRHSHASAGRLARKMLGPLAEDGFYSRSTIAQREEKEKHGYRNWSLYGREP